MKLYNLFLTCLCLISAISCTTDDFSNNTESNSSAGQDTDLYLSLSLSRNDGDYDTRSYTWDSTDNYAEEENTIVNGRVLIFEDKDGSEGNAEYVAFGILENPVPGVPALEFISKSVHYNNIPLSKFEFDASKTYYILVVLNHNSDFKFPYFGQTFSAWATEPQSSNMLIDVNPNADNNRKKYITMVNATGHLNKSSGDSYNPKTLVALDPEDISSQPFEDTKTPKTIVYVHRNVAKVIVRPKGGVLPGEKKLVTVGPFTFQVSLSVWKLQILNKTTYPVMNIDGLSWEKSHSHSGISTFDYVFWAKDPNYHNDSPLENSNFNKNSTNPWQTSPELPLYCLENTFDYDCMLQGQTTRAMIRCSMQWKIKGKDIGEDASESDYNTRWRKIVLPDDYIWAADADKTEEPSDWKDYNNSLDAGFFKIGEGNSATIWDFKHIKEALENKAVESYKKNIEVTWKEPSNGGYFLLSELIEVSFKENDGNEVPDFNILGKALNLENASSQKIAYYQNCYIYYPIRIRHFDDTETPWDNLTEVENGKAKYTQNHLGRYGVVRNNFYEIVINSISGLGYPEEFPAINDDYTDDMPEDIGIDVSIRTLKWSVKQNSFEF